MAVKPAVKRDVKVAALRARFESDTGCERREWRVVIEEAG